METIDIKKTDRLVIEHDFHHFGKHRQRGNWTVVLNVTFSFAVVDRNNTGGSPDQLVIHLLAPKNGNARVICFPVYMYMFFLFFPPSSSTTAALGRWQQPLHPQWLSQPTRSAHHHVVLHHNSRQTLVSAFLSSRHAVMPGSSLTCQCHPALWTSRTNLNCLPHNSLCRAVVASAFPLAWCQKTLHLRQEYNINILLV